jgi:2-desacetyl-2-hydroxyethyl bacteriochlorophyllide A dehydrogenase
MPEMNRHSLYFIAPGRLETREEPCPIPASDQVLVKTCFSAISPGTEGLVYRGQFPDELTLDATIGDLASKFSYPLKYGYAAVGQVLASGRAVDPAWEGRWVFAFHPHESHFIAQPEDLIPVPPGISPEQAVFVANMETAVNFLMDGAPLIGDRVVVFGQGIVGLLTTALLARFPLAKLISLDRYLNRRQASLELGAHASLAPEELADPAQINHWLPGKADLVYELSGDPVALDQAISLTGFTGRVVIGSWYGKKRANLNLGGHFHRNRIRLLSSQVSSLDPALSGRWTKSRRFDLAWEMIRQVRPQQLITQRLPLEQAGQAYQLLDQTPEAAIQVIFSYSD